ncbi:hypothetical protein BV22DRAFT_1031526 [Leucogyrophana mollusca]|uniref:Uncharacterized protein n=1 Tax=Leucogyrophana mollusca TaxID=85980 RepID=A0ACB8BPS3_9AGAM|nr:hypothetical protein BV22DRAFT_1031526 [Leucogyrophana mollusca]
MSAPYKAELVIESQTIFKGPKRCRGHWKKSETGQKLGVCAYAHLQYLAVWI